jgi:hypothetical protein
VRLFVAGLILASSVAASSPDTPAAICVDDRVSIGPRVRAAFDRELQALMPAVYSCSVPAVQVSIRSHAPIRYATALGLARTANGRVLPAIELYTSNIVKALDTRAGADRFGRALARVAYHELQHYRLQKHDHDAHGLFARALNARTLLTSGR